MTFIHTRSRCIALVLLSVSTAVFVATAWHQHQLNRFAENQAICAHPNYGFNFLAAAYPSPENEPDETDDSDEPTAPCRPPRLTNTPSPAPSSEDFISAPAASQSQRGL